MDNALISLTSLLKTTNISNKKCLNESYLMISRNFLKTAASLEICGGKRHSRSLDYVLKPCSIFFLNIHKCFKWQKPWKFFVFSEGLWISVSAGSSNLESVRSFFLPSLQSFISLYLTRKSVVQKAWNTQNNYKTAIQAEKQHFYSSFL